jgi:hypothetical protein
MPPNSRFPLQEIQDDDQQREEKKIMANPNHGAPPFSLPKHHQISHLLRVWM